MNERIKELEEQAMEWIPDHRNPEWAQAHVFNKEKFAKLIIWECYQWAKENGGISGSIDYSALNEHFGVTE